MERRDFAKDREICNSVPEGPWMTAEQHSLTTIHYVAGADGASLFITEPSLSHSTTLGEPLVRFVATARTGWPAALDEIDTLQGILRDMQQDSMAYLQGTSDGRAIGYAEGINEALLQIEAYRAVSFTILGYEVGVDEMKAKLAGKCEEVCQLIRLDTANAVFTKMKNEARDEVKAEMDKIKQENAYLKRKMREPIRFNFGSDPRKTKEYSVTYDTEFPKSKEYATRAVCKGLADHLIEELKTKRTLLIHGPTLRERPIGLPYDYRHELVGQIHVIDIGFPSGSITHEGCFDPTLAEEFTPCSTGS